MVTNEYFKRLAALILVLFHIVAAGETARAGDWMPLLPSQDFYDFQLFAPPDMQDYEIYPEPSEGIYFKYDRLYWGITPPRVTGVGNTPAGYIIPNQPISPQTLVNLNNQAIQAGQNLNPPYTNGVIGGLYTFGSDVMQLDLNTSWMRTKMAWGNRYEGGWIYDQRGIDISYFTVGSQGQEFQTLNEFAASSPTQIFTQSTSSGGTSAGGAGTTVSQPQTTSTITSVSPPPDHIISQKLTQKNDTTIESVGVTTMIRRELGGRGSNTTAKFSFGPRFLQFADRYKLGYESNQYTFNRATSGGAGGATGGGTTGGGTTSGGTTGGGTTGGGTTGGGTTSGGTTGGTTGSTSGGSTGGSTSQTSTSQIGGGNLSNGVTDSSAGSFFEITGEDAITGRGVGTPLQAGAWETYTSNNMVGPEFGLMMESQQGRWSFSSALKFTAGLNWQNNLYRGSNFPTALGADYLRTTFTIPAVSVSNGDPNGTQTPIQPPPLFLQVYGTGQQNATNAAEHRFVFSPIGEWRFGTEYRVSQSILLKAGYTGMWMSGIARASTNTGYATAQKTVEYARQSNGSNIDPATNQTVPNKVWYVDRRVVDYNRIAPVQGGVEYVLTNGIDFGMEVRY